MPDVFISSPNPRTKEGSSFAVTAYFRNSSNAATAPTTSRYRIDCLTTGKEITDWTSLTPAVSNSISITATENKIQDHHRTTETKQIIVESDTGLDAQTRAVSIWKTENMVGVS